MATHRPDDEKHDVELADQADILKNPTTKHLKDPANAAFVQHFGNQDETWRDQFEAKLLRKLDSRLLPMLIVMYLLNFLDRSNLAQARQGTLEEDLDMHGTDFNLATSIFFIGYLLMQLPSNMLITRVRPSLYLSASCCLWGVVSTCNSATQKFSDLVVVRFFLGFVEAPFFPGAVFLMSSWYTRAELTRRISWFYSGNALANMFGGLLGAAILENLEGSMGIAGWRWLFIIVSLREQTQHHLGTDKCETGGSYRHIRRHGGCICAARLSSHDSLADRRGEGFRSLEVACRYRRAGSAA